MIIKYRFIQFGRIIHWLNIIGASILLFSPQYTILSIIWLATMLYGDFSLFKRLKEMKEMR